MLAVFGKYVTPGREGSLRFWRRGAKMSVYAPGRVVHNKKLGGSTSAAVERELVFFACANFRRPSAYFLHKIVRQKKENNGENDSSKSSCEDSRRRQGQVETRGRVRSR